MVIVKQWQIYFLDLEPVIGSEQGGTRPCVVISPDYANRLNQVTILPLTSLKTQYKKIYPNEVLLEQEITSLPKTSIALAHQIRSIDKQRLAKYVSVIIDENIKTKIQKAIKWQLAL